MNLVVIVDRELPRRGREPARARRALPPVAARDRRGRRGPHRSSTRGRRSPPTTPCTSPGHIAVGRERVEVDIGPQHLERLDTIVDPLLVPDLATMVWAPHGHHDGVEALRRLANIVLIDTQDEPESAEAFERAGRPRRAPPTSSTSPGCARRRGASASPRRSTRRRCARALGAIDKVVVRHRADSTAAGVLFCGWLASRLGWRPERARQRGRPLTGHCRARRGEVALELRARSELGAPGLGGVTIEMASGEAVSLDRGPGGLRAVRRARDGAEQSWTVLGASRGEAGILGEGVRQALLRDPTYKPALAGGRRWR